MLLAGCKIVSVISREALYMERDNHRKMYTMNGHSFGAVKKELYICCSVISGSVVTRVYCTGLYVNWSLKIRGKTRNSFKSTAVKKD